MTPTLRSPWAAVGALLVGLGVAVGAFGAHALEPILTEDRMGTFETAVRYQTVQGLGVLLLGLGPIAVRVGAPLLVLGILVFSGSLYGIVAFDLPVLGAIAPVGGVMMIAAWIWTAWRLWRG